MATPKDANATAEAKPAEKQDPKEATAFVQDAQATGPEGSLDVKQLQRVVTEVWQGTKPQPTKAVLEAALEKAGEVDDKGAPKNKHKDTESAKGWAQGLLAEKAA